jgi:hypothetical protein
MPAIDNCQPQMIHALEKDGWRVHLQNAHFYNDGDSIYIDLGIKKPSSIGDSDSILIEIKCFSEKRSLSELYLALGQVSYYRAFLDELDNNTPIYLAVPYEIYLTQLNRVFENALKQSRVGLLVIDIVSEEIIEWIK